ncbi:MAG: glycosyltransferase, partial [Syntrophaceae bacterium]|nr:glycosyltransferase [Syntrophaceae bacterium]
CPVEDYIFSFGRSDRDYDTLVRAVASLNIQTYILSSQYKPRVPLPANVSILREYISGREMVRWITASRIVVLPLLDYRISAGQLSMLDAMALARPVIVTKNMATKEYAVDGETVLFYSAGNASELAEKIQYLWEHREEAERIGREARQAAWKQNDKRDAIFSRLLERCAVDIQKGDNP